MLCPMKLKDGKFGPCEQSCAWYDNETKCCAVALIAAANPLKNPNVLIREPLPQKPRK